MSDILFNADNNLFSYRVSGIIIHNDKVLLSRGSKDNYYALPGGHVQFGETTSESILRELKEELQSNFKIERILWIEENFWKWGNKDAQQICLSFLISIIDDTLPLTNFTVQENTDKTLHFDWVKISDLKNHAIYPTFLSHELTNLSPNIKHFIYKE